MIIDTCLSSSVRNILSSRRRHLKNIVDIFIIVDTDEDIIEACKDFSDDDIFMLSDYNQIPSVEAVEFRKAHVLQYPMTCKSGTVITTLGYARQVGVKHLRENRLFYSPFPL